MSLARFQDMVGKAHARGQIQGPLGIDGWKPATQETLKTLGLLSTKAKKAKINKPKAQKQRRQTRDTKTTIEQRFILVDLVKNGARPIEDLISYAEKHGLTIAALDEWHEQESIARTQAEYRRLNG